MKTLIAILFARFIRKKNQNWINNPIEHQQKTFVKLISKSKNTEFGNDHHFSEINSYETFKKNVPVRDYEGLKKYIDRVVSGEKNILWPGKPLYFAKTSGTTSGAKYIPITKSSIKTHVRSARDALLNYFLKSKNYKSINGKHMFLQGSPELTKKNGVFIGRLSGISAHYIPRLFLQNRMPSWKTNTIEDWEEKVDKIIQETVGQKMTIIAGIPSWIQMYFEKIVQTENTNISNVFPELSLYVYGGVSYEPYKIMFEKLFGKKIDTLATFPASEGFFGYQDEFTEKDPELLLLLNNDIFYEFIKTEDFINGKDSRLSLESVELDVNYVLIISTSAGLWAYNIGDTIRFTSLNPYRIIVTGRIKQFLSAFGEHVISEEVEKALSQTLNNTNVIVKEFTVAPQINPREGLPHHDWYIDFEVPPNNIKDFSKELDNHMRRLNIYYDDLVAGGIVKPLIVKRTKQDDFKNYMRSVGKLGGQNKVPRLSNDRKIVDQLTLY
jgi:hypothetical protein